VGRRIATASAISGMRCGSHVEKVANMSVCPFVSLNLFPVVFVEILVIWLYIAQCLPLRLHSLAFHCISIIPRCPYLSLAFRQPSQAGPQMRAGC
jgi:hypothetical protein